MVAQEVITKVWNEACNIAAEEQKYLNSSLNYGAPKVDDSYERYSASQLMSMANSGDVKAQYELGNEYSKQGNNQDALYWFEKSANAGYTLAMEALGLAYYYGSWGEVNKGKAAEWFNKAAHITCSFTSAEMLGRYYSNEGENFLYDNMKLAYKWMVVSAALLGEQSARRARVEQIVMWLDTYVNFSFDLDYEKKKQIDFKDVEHFAKLLYYWIGIARDLGTPDNTQGIPRGRKVLRYIGQAAMKNGDRFGEEIVRVAFENGDDYAAVVLIPGQFEKAFGTLSTPDQPFGYHVSGSIAVPIGGGITPRLLNEAGRYVNDYLPALRAVTRNGEYAGRYQQAQAYYYLGVANTFGIGASQNANDAHDYFEKAAALNYPRAAAALKQYFKKTLFGWKILL